MGPRRLNCNEPGLGGPYPIPDALCPEDHRCRPRALTSMMPKLGGDSDLPHRDSEVEWEGARLASSTLARKNAIEPPESRPRNPAGDESEMLRARGGAQADISGHKSRDPRVLDGFRHCKSIEAGGRRQVAGGRSNINTFTALLRSPSCGKGSPSPMQKSTAFSHSSIRVKDWGGRGRRQRPWGSMEGQGRCADAKYSQTQ